MRYRFVMFKNLHDKIIALSLRDTKNLSEKGLKTMEEVGELGRAILPLVGAHGVNHRVPDVDKVVEECADVVLTALSIAISLGVSVHDFAQVLDRKSDYWEFLLDNEDKTDLQNLAFEIHITVAEAELATFRNDCADLGVKPIILDLYSGEELIRDVMTSSRFQGTTKGAIDQAKSLGRELRARGYNVKREKVETVPWHPAAQARPRQSSAYFEAHIAFDGPEQIIREFSDKHLIHLSRNTMKKGRESLVMGTYRIDARDITADNFQERIATIYQEANKQGLRIVEKPLTEYSIFDTNEQHDAEWING